MKKHGKNTKEVSEIIDFALNLNFLFGKEAPDYLNVLVVTNIPKDWLDTGPDGKEYWKTQEEEWTYRGIRENEHAKILQVLYDDEVLRSYVGSVRRIFTGGNRLYNQLIHSLNYELFEPDLIAELIIDDMLLCAEWRIICGVESGFWETIFQIYKSGGMPVGWSGKYPEGKLMAIYPGLG